MIKLTIEAAKEIERMSKDSDSDKLLRIFIEPGGCSGFEYGMSIDQAKDSDQLGESQGVQFAVDGESVEYLSGTEIHFDDGLSGKGFEIRNPNAQTTCGCGKSFS
jgi:iron-sulfur cluster assembly accessory protein